MVKKRGEIIIFVLLLTSFANGVFLLDTFRDGFSLDYLIGDKAVKQDVQTLNEEERLIEPEQLIDDERESLITVIDCLDENCFQENFSTCNPAILITEKGMIKSRLEIIGPMDNGCRVSFSYLTNPFADLVNKDMLCVLDNSKYISDQLEKVFEELFVEARVCQGPLVGAINNPLSYQ